MNFILPSIAPPQVVVYHMKTTCKANYPWSNIKAVFLFHDYYQIRRILIEMKVALWADLRWNAFDHSFDRSAYEQACAEFSVDKKPTADKRQVIIKDLEEYTNTGQMQDSIH